MRSLLKEPLLHFAIAGAALFGIYWWVRPQEPVETESREQIVVSVGRVERLADIFRQTWQRPPTKRELQAVVDEFVLEEVYYRQAVAMGLDQEDSVIRRRMRQKVEFLTDNSTALVEPSDQELASYLANNADMFRMPSTYTFQQLYFNPDKHGDEPKQYVQQQLEVLRKRVAAAGAASATESNMQPRLDDMGDVSLLPPALQDVTSREVDSMFGTGFSAALDNISLGQWQGPVRSGLGLHLVQIDGRTPGRVPDLEEIRASVAREWASAKRKEMRARINDKLLEKYDVVVQWPKLDDATAEGSGEDEKSAE